MPETLRIRIPCRRFDVSVYFGHREGLSPLEEHVLLAVAVGANTTTMLEAALCVGSRLVLDVCIDLLGGGYLAVDKRQGVLSLVERVRDAIGDPTAPKDGWQNALRSQAPPHPEQYQLFQDLVSGSVFVPPPRDQDNRFDAYAPVNPNVCDLREIPKIDLMLALAGVAKPRSAVDGEEVVQGDMRVRDVSIVASPLSAGPTGTIPDTSAGSIMVEAICQRQNDARDGGADSTPVFRVIGPAALPASIRQSMASGLTRLWQDNVGCGKSQFFDKIRYEDPGGEDPEEAALTNPTQRLAELKAAVKGIVTEGLTDGAFDALVTRDGAMHGELALAAKYRVRAVPIVGAPALNDELLRALREAKHQVVVTSPWARRLSNDEALKQALREAVLTRGLDVYLLWGIGQAADRSDAFGPSGWEFVEQLRERARNEGQGAVHVSDYPCACHAKLVACDLSWVVVGSYNYLSGRPDRAALEVGVRVLPDHTAEQGRRPPVSSAVLETLQRIRSWVPDYRIARSLDILPTNFGLEEWVDSFDIGGIEKPDLTPSGMFDAMTKLAYWCRGVEERVQDYGKFLDGIQAFAHPLFDAENRLQFMYALGAAQTRLLIASPSMGTALLGDEVVARLCDAAQRLTVQIVYAKVDDAARSRFEERKADLEKAGVRIAQRDIHAKVLVMDEWSITSSFNFLSYHGYFESGQRARHELGMRVRSAPLADALWDAVALGKA